MSTSDNKSVERVSEEADVPVDEVEERVEEQLVELKKHQAAEVPEGELRSIALRIVKNDLLNMTGGSGFGGGEATEFSLLTLGFQRREGDYFVTDGDALLGSGIINPPDEPAGFSTFVLDSAHGVDLEHVAEAFMPLNTVRGYASFRRVGSRDNEPTVTKGGNPTYVTNSTDDSQFEIVSPDDVGDDDPISDLPSDKEAKRNMIHDHFITDEDVVTLQTYAEHETAKMPPAKSGREYEVAFGVDVKRLRGEVVDSVIFSSGDGAMTLTDETVFSEEDIPAELISDQMRTPGLQVQIAGDLVYGENSVLDVYGFIQQRDDGQYRMQGLGVIPIVEFDYEGPEVGGDSGADDEAVEEDTI